MKEPICENCFVLPICNKREILIRIQRCDILKQAIGENISKKEGLKTLTPPFIYLLENYRLTTLEIFGIIYNRSNTDTHLIDLRITDVNGLDNPIIKTIQLDKREDLVLDKSWSPRILLTGTRTTYIEDIQQNGKPHM